MADLKSGEGVENEVGMGQKYVFNTSIKLENDSNYAMLLRTAAKRNVSVGTTPTEENLTEFDVELIGTKPNIRRLISRFAQWFNVQKDETTNEESYVKYKPRYYYVHEVEIDLTKLPTRVFEQLFKAGIIIKEYNMETMVARLAGVKQEVLKITRLFFDHKVVAKDVQRVKESKSEKTIALRKLMRLAGLNENMCQHHLDEMDDDNGYDYDDMRDNVYKAPLDEEDEDYEDDDEDYEGGFYPEEGDRFDDIFQEIMNNIEEKNPEFEMSMYHTVWDVKKEHREQVQEQFDEMVEKIIQFIKQN